MTSVAFSCPPPVLRNACVTLSTFQSSSVTKPSSLVQDPCGPAFQSQAAKPAADDAHAFLIDGALKPFGFRERCRMDHRPPDTSVYIRSWPCHSRPDRHILKALQDFSCLLLQIVHLQQDPI